MTLEEFMEIIRSKLSGKGSLRVVNMSQHVVNGYQFYDEELVKAAVDLLEFHIMIGDTDNLNPLEKLAAQFILKAAGFTKPVGE